MASENITTKKRIVLVDTLYGYALMGLFLVHMVEYFELYWYNPDPGIYKDIAFGMFGGKADARLEQPNLAGFIKIVKLLS